MKVPFNEPYFSKTVISQSLTSPDILRTQGRHYQDCKDTMQQKLGFKNLILTPSCTSALELVALALNIKKGDEVILPSYTYVSTANAFALRGAKLIFVDCYPHHPSIDISKIEAAITIKTKAIIVVHYGGIAIDYPLLKKLKEKHSIPIIEDAAHCFGARSGEDFIGTLGDFATFSFHETKNISCGQGGAVVINNSAYSSIADTIAQCGTNKVDFINKKVPFYSWKSLGSNFLLAEPLCAILSSSLQQMTKINERRASLCQSYHIGLTVLKKRGVTLCPSNIGGNGHIFYLLTKNLTERDQLIAYLKLAGVEATFHYFPLHLTEFASKITSIKRLKNTEHISDTIVRLPMYYKLKASQQQHVINSVIKFYVDR